MIKTYKPIDILGIITSFQTIEDTVFLVQNPEQYIVKYKAKESDTDDTLKHFKNLLYLNGENFTNESLKLLSTKLQLLYCGHNKNMTDEGLKSLSTKLQILDCCLNKLFSSGHFLN